MGGQRGEEGRGREKWEGRGRGGKRGGKRGEGRKERGEGRPKRGVSGHVTSRWGVGEERLGSILCNGGKSSGEKSKCNGGQYKRVHITNAVTRGISIDYVSFLPHWLYGNIIPLPQECGAQSPTPHLYSSLLGQ